jgi:tRNA(Ile)-lysidine synthase
MLKRFLEHLSKLVGNPHAHSYLLAVSGGADSMVMAHLFRDAGLNFAMAHCNFHLRGEDSNRDMRLVEDVAKTWDNKLFVKEFNTLEQQKNSGKSIEMVARDLRYQWFDEIATDYEFIVTAHQADDAAETLLLNLCRGCALKGLTAIPEKNGRIIRPLLNFSAQEIRSYAQQNSIPFAIDCTNTDETIKRNRIRASVIPILKELNPNLIDTISHNREILCQQFNLYQNSIECFKTALVTEENGVVRIDRQKIQTIEQQSIILYEILSDYGFGDDTVSELCHDAKQSGTQYHSPTHTLLVNRDEYLIRPNEKKSSKYLVLNSLDDMKAYFSIDRLRNDGNISFEKNNQILYLDEKDLVFPVLIRNWESGDYFYPLGGTGKQKISDYFSDHKFDRFAKEHTLLMEINHQIVWIIGHRSDNRYKIDPKYTKNYYIIRYNGTL